MVKRKSNKEDVKKHEGIYIHIKKRTLQGLLAMIPACIPLLLILFTVGSMAYFDEIVHEDPDDKESPMVDLMSDATPTNDQFGGATHINVSKAWMTFYITIFCICMALATLGSVGIIIVVCGHFFGDKDDE